MKKYIQPQITQMSINIESHLLLASGEQDTKLQVTNDVIKTEDFAIGKGWASDDWTEE